MSTLDLPRLAFSFVSTIGHNDGIEASNCNSSVFVKEDNWWWRCGFVDDNGAVTAVTLDKLRWEAATWGDCWLPSEASQGSPVVSGVLEGTAWNIVVDPMLHGWRWSASASEAPQETLHQQGELFLIEILGQRVWPVRTEPVGHSVEVR